VDNTASGALFREYFPAFAVDSNGGDGALSPFGQSLLACHGSLYRYARALCRDPARADDLVQETIKRALSAGRRPQAPTVAEVRPWAFTIMRNVWQNELRRRNREVAAEAAGHALALQDGPETPETLLARKLLRSEIACAIDSLPAPYREVVILREIEGLSYAEIARVAACPVGTVMSRLARARNLLRRALTRYAPVGREVGR